MRRNTAGQLVTFSLYKSGDRIANPTRAAGDFTRDLDGAGQGNVTTLPTTDAAGLVFWYPSQPETNADVVTFLANDAAGDEWEPLTISFVTETETLGTIAALIAALNDVSIAQIWGELVPAAYGVGTAGNILGNLAASVWEILTATLTTVGSIGNYIVTKLALITSGSVVFISPVLTSGNVQILQGDVYEDVDGRRLEWSSAGWAIGAASTILVIIRGTKAFTGIRISGTEAGLEMTAAETAALSVGTFDFYVQEVQADGEHITLVDGKWVTFPLPVPLTP